MAKKFVTHAHAIFFRILAISLISFAVLLNKIWIIYGQNVVDASTKTANNDVPSVSRANSSNRDFVAADCLTARSDTVPVSFFQKLPKPFINLGFPKMGTTSLHAYFKCGGLVSAHWENCGNPSMSPQDLCAKCMKKSVDYGLPPLSLCRTVDAYTQIDDGRYFPQIELLEEFVHGYPNATFFLTFRSMEKWYHSISHWPLNRSPKLDERIKNHNITGSPSNEGRSNLEEFSDWYCKHVQRVRNIVSQNPSHTLVEVDIEDSGTGERMEEIFGIDKSCWGHTNVNAIIHPELNLSEVHVAKAHQGNQAKRTKKISKKRKGMKPRNNRKPQKAPTKTKVHLSA